MRVPPPVTVALIGGAAAGIEHLWPTPFAAGAVAAWLGAALVAGGLALNGLAAVALRR